MLLTDTSRLVKILSIAIGAAILTACASNNNSSAQRNIGLPSYKASSGKTYTTVNRYLWAATLETLDFMPMQSADPIAGVILTEWYANPETPNERFKTNVYILSNELRADGLRVSVFKQTNNGGFWQDAAVNPATAREIENAILSRARQLRLGTAG